MANDTQLPGILQALEHCLEMVDRQHAVITQFVAASRRGELLPAAVVEDYAGQLRTVAQQLQQARAGMAVWWALIGREGVQ
jgi:hypothetical protein